MPAEGCPVAVEVFEGNIGDPSTLASQVAKLKERFKLERLVLIGDRGMITAARLEETIKPAGLDWITALRAPQIRALVEAGAIQLSLFDERDLAEIAAPDYPGERLMVCRNPLLAEERARKRGELLGATEKKLTAVAARVQRARKPMRGKDRIALAVGRVIDRYKMAKHFTVAIADDGLAFARNAAQIDAEAALDGVYVVRTSLTAETLDAGATVKAYKQLANAERAFRSLKTVDIEVRPIHHRRVDRVRAHVFLCMLAYYVEWHMRQALKPILFDDHDKAQADAARASIVGKAKRSKAADRKAVTPRTEDGLPIHSFRSLLADLATVTRNTMAMATSPDATLVIIPNSRRSGPRLPTPRHERQAVASNPARGNPTCRVRSDTYVAQSGNFRLVVASLVGGPFAGCLIHRHRWPDLDSGPGGGRAGRSGRQFADDINHITLLRTLLILNLVILIGFALRSSSKGPSNSRCSSSASLVGWSSPTRSRGSFPQKQWPTQTSQVALISDLGLDILSWPSG